MLGGGGGEGKSVKWVAALSNRAPRQAAEITCLLSATIVQAESSMAWCSSSEVLGEQMAAPEAARRADIVFEATCCCWTMAPFA